jgi:hydrogenase small subunit
VTEGAQPRGALPHADSGFLRERGEPAMAPINVLWITSGLGCDGESVAITAATSPSLEDLLRGCMPGMPPLILYNPLLAYENGEDFMRVFFEAAEGRLSRFILVLEGSVPNEEVSGEGCWASFGTDPLTREPISTCTWIDRLAPHAAAVLAMGTCAAYGGIPAMRNNPTGAMGLRDYLGWDWTSRLGVPIVNLPGCPVQPDNITETLLCMVLHLAGIGPELALDEQGRPKRIFGRTAHESCNRVGLAETGTFSDTHGDGRCLVKLGCKGPVARCNVPIRGWINGIGGCPNIGGICIACTMPGFPDKYLPFMAPDPAARVYTTASRLSHGAVFRYLRELRMRRTFEVEPKWRRPSERLETGYRRSW